MSQKKKNKERMGNERAKDVVEKREKKEKKKNEDRNFCEGIEC